MKNNAPNLAAWEMANRALATDEVTELQVKANPPRVVIEDPTDFAPFASRICPFATLATALDVVKSKTELIAAASVAVSKDLVIFPMNADRLILGNRKGKLGGHLCAAPLDPGLPVSPVAACLLTTLLASAIGVEVGDLGIDTTLVMTDSKSNRLAATRRGAPEGSFPLVKDPKTWFEELPLVLTEGAVMGVTEPWFRRVYDPLRKAHACAKDGNLGQAMKWSNECRDPGWKESFDWFWNTQAEG